MAAEVRPEAAAEAQPEATAEVRPETAAEMKPKATAEVQSEEALIPAGQYLDLDLTRSWPEDVEDLRILFLTFPRYQPFEMDGYIFVRAGMAEETGIDHCAVGIRAQGGEVTGVVYAIPMPYSPQPPVGLEEAFWVGDGTKGWWVTEKEIVAGGN